MIWIGTSGWIYPHWVGRFYPPDLPVREHLAYYAQHFPTVEINRSFYRLPTYDQFQAWSEQVQCSPDFLFAVKASRYMTHMKKLQHAEDGVQRLDKAAHGLGKHLGPFLYQLPPHWRANLPRLEQFVASLPPDHRAAFEFRDPDWFLPEWVPELHRVLDIRGCALVISVGGALPTPSDVPPIGSFHYLRFHHGEHGIGFTDNELATWAQYVSELHSEEGDTFVYFNNDPDGHAVEDAFRLRHMLGNIAVGPGI
jgi:uncharacterized protein YecE (DUF72 family)